MIIKTHTTYLSPLMIETGLWHIERYLGQKFGFRNAERDMEPLKWFIYTGRASCDFIHAVLNAKPYMIGRKLHQGGSYDETIQRIKDYIGWEEAE